MITIRRQFLAWAGGAVGLGAAPPPQTNAPEPPKPVAGVDLKKYRAAIAAGDAPNVNHFIESDSSLVYLRDENGVSVLLLACLAGHASVRDLLVSKGMALDIHEAAASGSVKRLNELLSGAPNAVNLNHVAGYTPLHLAAACGQTAIVDILLGKGANLDAKNPGTFDETPVHAALQCRDDSASYAAAYSMLRNGANPSAARKDGVTLLHAAAGAGRVESAALLLRKGARADVKDASGKTPRDYALANRRADVAALLEHPGRVPPDCYTGRFAWTRSGEPLAALGNRGLPPLWVNEFVMSAHFDLEKTKRLYATCSDLLLGRSTFDELAVEGAAHMGRADIAEFLLDKGSPLSLCTASMLGLLDRVKRLLEEDSQRVRERGAHDFPLIWYPAWGKEQVETAEYLLRSGADPDAASLGSTALHIAAKKGQYEMCRLLLEHGANPDLLGRAADGSMQTPVQMAAKAGHNRLVELFHSYTPAPGKTH